MTVKSSEDKSITSDGGSTNRSPFTTLSDTTVSKRDRYRRYADIYIFAPSRIIWSDSRAKIGLSIILFYIIMGTVGVILIPQPDQSQGPSLLKPFKSLQYPLGTGMLKQGILRQIVHGTPAMLKMILSGAVFTTALATIVGTFSGYKRGPIDGALMLLTDVMMTIPGLPLVIVLAVVLQPRDPFIVGIILSVNAWAGLARTIRSQVLSLRSESYVEASRVMGVPTWNIIADDVVPNLMPYIMVNFVYSARNVIFASVGLYFLGFLPFSQKNWGVMMNFAYETGGALYTWDTAHWLFFPMLTIIILVFGLILFAQGTDRLFNPRVRARHAKTLVDEETEAESEESTEERVRADI